MKPILIILFTLFATSISAQKISNPTINYFAKKIGNSLIAGNIDSINALIASPEIFIESRTTKMDDKKIGLINANPELMDIYKNATEHYLLYKSAEAYLEAFEEAYKSNVKFKNCQLDSVLVFLDFGFESEQDTFVKYQVYYFLLQKSNHKKYIAEGDINIYKGVHLLSYDLDAIHPANSLQEYIQIRSDEDHIESHPPSVSAYLQLERTNIPFEVLKEAPMIKKEKK